MSLKGCLLMLVAVAFSTNAYAHRPGFYKIDDQNEVQVVFHKSGLKCNVDIDGAPEKEGYLRLFVFSDSATKAPYSYESGFYVEVHFEGVEHYVKIDHYDHSTKDCVLSSKGIKLFAEDGKLGSYEILHVSDLPAFEKK